MLQIQIHALIVLLLMIYVKNAIQKHVYNAKNLVTY